MARRKGRSRRSRRRHGLPAIPRGYCYRRLTIGNRTIEEILPIGLHPRLQGRVFLEELTEEDVRRLRDYYDVLHSVANVMAVKALPVVPIQNSSSPQPNDGRR